MNFLFLHGLAGNPSDWDSVSKILQNNGHVCIAPEIPYLDSDFHSLDNLASKLKLLIDKDFLDKKSIIVGNSLGGSLALKLGTEVKKITLVASYTTTSTEWIGRGKETLNREINRIFYNPKKLSKEKRLEYEELWSNSTLNRKNFSKLIQLKKAIKNDSLDFLYDTYQSKIHAICGANDQLSPLENFYKLKLDFPKIKITEIKYCGHAIPIEKPNELSKILLQNLI